MNFRLKRAARQRRAPGGAGQGVVSGFLLSPPGRKVSGGLVTRITSLTCALPGTNFEVVV